MRTQGSIQVLWFCKQTRLPLGHEVRSCAALNNHTNRRDSSTFVFVTRVIEYIVSSELHLSVFGTETISSDKRPIDISDTLQLLYFVKKMSEYRYDIRVSESCVGSNP